MVQRRRPVYAGDLVHTDLHVAVRDRLSLTRRVYWHAGSLPRVGDELDLTTLADLGTHGWDAFRELTHEDQWSPLTPDDGKALRPREPDWKLRSWVGAVIKVRHSAENTPVRTSLTGDPAQLRVWGRSASVSVEADEPEVDFRRHRASGRLSDEEYKHLLQMMLRE